MTNIIYNDHKSGKKENFTCLIITGWGLAAEEWELFLNEAAPFLNFFAFNRKGYSIEPEGSYPRSSVRIAEETAELLAQTDGDEKIILIAHDAGGLYARIFLDMFPEKVAGIIFVDSLTEYENEFYLLGTPKFYASASNNARINMMRQLLLTDPIMHRKMLEPMMEIFYSKYSESSRDAILNHAASKNMIRSLLSEYDSRQEMFELLSNMPISDIPVRIIHRDPQMMVIVSEQFGIPRNESMLVEELWFAHTTRLAQKFIKSKLIEAKGCDHSIHIANPGIIIETLLDLIKELEN